MQRTPFVACFFSSYSLPHRFSVFVSYCYLCIIPQHAAQAEETSLILTVKSVNFTKDWRDQIGNREADMSGCVKSIEFVDENGKTVKMPSNWRKWFTNAVGKEIRWPHSAMGILENNKKKKFILILITD